MPGRKLSFALKTNADSVYLPVVKRESKPRFTLRGVKEHFFMSESEINLPNPTLRTPRAAAIAGILFALLYGIGYILIQLAIPDNFSDSPVFSEDQVTRITYGLSFLPFAGIAFLWFLGVIRDRMGVMEDQFYSTLFLGSGLLYLGMTFTAAAIAGGTLAAYAIDPETVVSNGFHLVARTISNRLTSVYAIRMAGMFMIVLATIWVRTQIMPRWLALITYATALVLLISVGLTHWVILTFPAWVLVISAYILYLNFLFKKGELEIDGVTLDEF
jgi:hypothetical protein